MKKKDKEIKSKQRLNSENSERTEKTKKKIREITKKFLELMSMDLQQKELTKYPKQDKDIPSQNF